MAAIIPGNTGRQNSMQRTLYLILRIYESFPEVLQNIPLGIIDQNWVTCPLLNALLARGSTKP